MPSDQSVDISDLVRATEGNIARITAVSGKFALPCLNEWRYATKHVALLLNNPNDSDQREKAIGHLKRAYFDSSDILLTVLLDSLRKVFEDVGAYSDVAAKVIPGYEKWATAFSEALALQYEPVDDRLSRARKMDDMSNLIVGFVNQAAASRGALLAAIARECRKERWQAIGAISSAVAVLVALASFLWRR